MEADVYEAYFGWLTMGAEFDYEDLMEALYGEDGNGDAVEPR